jgi:hypothetical protein
MDAKTDQTNSGTTYFDAGISLKDPALAKWIRAPRGAGLCPHTGMRRTALYQLAKRFPDKIKVCRLHEQGARRGAVLFWLPSIMQFLHGKAEEQASSSSTDEAIASLPTEGGPSNG